MQPVILFRQLILSATLCSTVTTWHARHSCAATCFNTEVNAPAFSGVLSSSLVSRSAFSSQVTEAPTRNGTGGVMPLADAITQLSFLCFFHSAAEFQLLLPSRLNHQFPSHFWRLLCRRLHLVTSPRMCLRRRLINRDTLSCVVAVQTSFYGAPTLSLDAAAQTTSPSTSSQHASAQMGSRSASSFSVGTSVQISAHSVVQLDAARVGILFVSPRHQYWAHMWHLYRRLDLNNQPLPQ